MNIALRNDLRVAHPTESANRDPGAFTSLLLQGSVLQIATAGCSRVGKVLARSIKQR
jgi:hypothetical protein